ncbi:hypothetical protein PX699_25040 [Sphingobium sp. H39-3-25]|uniref:PAS domain-containing protein n=1 Tax=Sphingobium arseniciresistens TaxID=3030834 RepID=UPI0023B94FE6|nr:hypothetical protein [Sphingobium arseniciresistens]
MDTLRGQDAAGGQDDFDYAVDDVTDEPPPPSISTDERRMHVRAYNYWASLLHGRALPSIEDLNPEELGDFGPYSVLLDFGSGVENPSIVYLGTELRRECEIEGHIDTISEVPARSLLTRLTDHYLQIIANAAPIGFEAEFTNQRGAEIMYRGILMPFSSDDETIDFVYGVINWKEVASRALTDELVLEVDRALRSAPRSKSPTPIWADGPSRGAGNSPADMADTEATLPELDLSGLEMPDPTPEEDAFAAAFTLDAGSSLWDWLALARDCAEDARGSDARSRSALYRAIGLAYDFALAAQDAPEAYAELLEDSGINVQARSPMTAIAKLVFGTTYDKTRLTEYATALDHGQAQGMERGGMAVYLEQYDGGLKGLVRDERAARRAERPVRPDPAVAARARLRSAQPLSMEAIQTDAEGLALVVARREADGSMAIVAALPADADPARRVVTMLGH